MSEKAPEQKVEGITEHLVKQTMKLAGWLLRIF